MDDPGPSRLYLKNLSFGVSKKAIVSCLANFGFWVTVDDVHIWRAGNGGSLAMRKMCTGFIKMATWEDVDHAIRLLNGRLLPELSPCALHAERALPRMSILKQKELLPDKTEPKNDEDKHDEAAASTVPTEGACAIASMIKVKEEMKAEVEKKKEFDKADRKAEKKRKKEKKENEKALALSTGEPPWKRRMKARDEM